MWFSLLFCILYTQKLDIFQNYLWLLRPIVSVDSFELNCVFETEYIAHYNRLHLKAHTDLHFQFLLITESLSCLIKEYIQTKDYSNFYSNAHNRCWIRKFKTRNLNADFTIVPNMLFKYRVRFFPKVLRKIAGRSPRARRGKHRRKPQANRGQPAGELRAGRGQHRRWTRGARGRPRVDAVLSYFLAV